MGGWEERTQKIFDTQQQMCSSCAVVIPSDALKGAGKGGAIDSHDCVVSGTWDTQTRRSLVVLREKKKHKPQTRKIINILRVGCGESVAPPPPTKFFFFRIRSSASPPPHPPHPTPAAPFPLLIYSSLVLPSPSPHRRRLSPHAHTHTHTHASRARMVMKTGAIQRPQSGGCPRGGLGRQGQLSGGERDERGHHPAVG